ncbi:hypothetical protein J7J37_01985 [bacterium]|nr:hypothetical protein [bacterium]
MSKPTHIKLIKKKRKRREKIIRLREKYKLAKSQEEKKRIVEKVKKIAPWLVDSFTHLL